MADEKLSQLNSIPSPIGTSDLFYTVQSGTSYKCTGQDILDFTGSVSTGAIEIIGTWNATTNTPTITSGVGTAWQGYEVTTAGNTIIDGVGAWSVGDVLLFDGNTNAWVKVFSTKYTPAIRVLGIWDAQTNETTLINGQPGGPLVSGVGEAWGGYGVNVAGNTMLDGNDVWNVGDFVIFNPLLNVWMKNFVTYLNGKSGALSFVADQNGVFFGDSQNWIDQDETNFNYDKTIRSFNVGENNTITGSSGNSANVGGQTNIINDATLSVQVAGFENSLSNSNTSSVIGGNNNTIDSASGSIVSGAGVNTITNIDATHITAIANSTIESANNSLIGGGNAHDIDSITYGAILGSQTVEIAPVGTQGQVGICTLGGHDITFDADYSSAVNSQNCSISGTGSLVLNAAQTTITHDGNVVISDNSGIPAFTSTLENQCYLGFENGVGINRQDTLSGLNATSVSFNYVATAYPSDTYVITKNDFQIGSKYAGAVSPTLILPDETTISVGRQIFVKDEIGNVGTGIIVSSPTSKTINGSATYTLNSINGEWQFYWTGIDWIATELVGSGNSVPNVPAGAIPYGSSDNVHLTSQVTLFSFDETNTSLALGVSNTNSGISSLVVGGSSCNIDSNSDKGSIIGSNSSAITNSSIGPNAILFSTSSTIDDSTSAGIFGGLNNSTQTADTVMIINGNDNGINTASYSMILNGNNVQISHDGVCIFTDGNDLNITSNQPNYSQFSFINGVGINKSPQTTLDVNGGFATNLTVVDQLTTYTATAQDSVLAVNYTQSGSGQGISLPSDLQFNGRQIIIKDTAGNAATKAITITPTGGVTVEGAANYTIVTDYGWVELRFCSSLSQWLVVSKDP